MVLRRDKYDMRDMDDANYNFTGAEAYLNRDEVKKLLHVPQDVTFTVSARECALANAE